MESFSLRQLSRAEIVSHRSVHPRQVLTPLQPPPTNINTYPALPSTRNSTFTEKYSISTHLFPAAYPRCPADVWTAPPEVELKDQKNEQIRQTVEFLSSLKEAQEQGRDTRPPMRKVFWTVANRYVHNSSSTSPGLTLVFLHGIGAHKETWEPIIKRFLQSLRDCGSSVFVQEIWTLDCVQHGDSGLLNEPVMGDTFDCADYARDLTSFLLSYLPDQVLPPGALPTNLQRLPESKIAGRQKQGLLGRTIVGIGHSIGACSFVTPSIQYPRLFSSLVLIESFTIPEFIKYLDAHRRNEALCLSRRWLWGSREKAIDSLRKSPYYRHWDPQSLDAFIEFALLQLPDGTVRTKTHPYPESVMLFERRVVYETWELLENIDPSITMHWVWGGKSGRQGGKSNQAQTSFRRAANSTNDFHPELGHLVPQEAPDLIASDITRFLLSRYEMKKSKL